MKKILAASLLCLLPVVGFAENEKKEESKRLMMNIEMICDDSSILDLVMIKYGEMPVVKMESVRRTVEGAESSTFVSVLFVNDKTRSWTLIEERGPLFCVVGVGVNIQAMFDNRLEKQKKYY